jgi:hypothetical protein
MTTPDTRRTGPKRGHTVRTRDSSCLVPSITFRNRRNSAVRKTAGPMARGHHQLAQTGDH